MEFHVRPSIVAAPFAILFAVIANLAWVTAASTSAPWFSPVVSLQVYTVSLIVATFLAVVLVLHGSSRVNALDLGVRRLDRRVALMRVASSRTVSDARRRSVPLPQELDDDLDDDSDVLPKGGPSMAARVEKEGHDALVELPAIVRTASASVRTEMLRSLVRERVGLREMRAQVRAAAAGPVLASLVFLAIAGPMLPGSDGFATSHYQLNTALILFLAYGVPALVAWSVIALAIMGSPRGHETV